MNKALFCFSSSNSITYAKTNYLMIFQIFFYYSGIYNKRSMCLWFLHNYFKLFSVYAGGN